MPFDSNGNYTLPTSYFVENGDTVLPIQHNPPFEDVAQALSSVLPRSGVAPMNGHLKMGGSKVTGMADGVATTDAVTKQQLDAAASDAATNNMKFASKSAAYTAVKADKATAFRFTAAATLSLTAAATLGANWWCEVQAANGSVTVDPNAAETIDGATTAIIQTGQIARISCDGTSFATEIVGNPLSGPQLQGYLIGLGLSTNAADPANDIDIAVGSAASDASPYHLMQLSAPITKRIDAAWAPGTNQGGLDTGTVAASGTYSIFEIQRSDTLAVDSIITLSSTGPLMPANYDRKRLIGSLVRTGGVNAKPAATGQSPIFVSTQQAFVAGSSLVLAHGLGAQPTEVFFEFVCKSAAGGYAVGDRVLMPSSTAAHDENYTNTGFSVSVDATNIRVHFATNGIPLTAKGGGPVFFVGGSQFDVIVRGRV